MFDSYIYTCNIVGETGRSLMIHTITLSSQRGNAKTEHNMFKIFDHDIILELCQPNPMSRSYKDFTQK